MKTNVLIVDDAPEIVEYLSVILQDYAISTVGVLTPQEGIEAAEQQNFDAIISDFSMPGMCGLEMISQIKSGGKNRATPIIVVSGKLTDEALERLEKVGIINVMSKPPELDILVRIIEKSAKRRRDTELHTYHPTVSEAFYDAFASVMKCHLGESVRIASPKAANCQSLDYESSGVVTLFGRRASGALVVSYGKGFTEVFAENILGRPVKQNELTIFEATAGDIAEQIGRAIGANLIGKVGVELAATGAVVAQGQRLQNPFCRATPMLQLSAELAGRTCVAEFGLVDLQDYFPGQVPEPALELIQTRPVEA